MENGMVPPQKIKNKIVIWSKKISSYLDVLNLKCLRDVQAEIGRYVAGWRSPELRGRIGREGINSSWFFFCHLYCPHAAREENYRKSTADWDGSVTSGQNNAIMPSQIIYLLTDGWPSMVRDFLGFKM